MFARVAAGLIGVAVLVPTLIWGGVLGVALVVGAAVVIGLFEYGRMAFPADAGALRWAVLVFGGAVYATTVYLSPLATGPTLAALTIASFLLVMAGAETIDGAADRVGRLVLGMCYVGFLLAFVALVRRHDQGVGWIFVLLATTWLGDTGAYFAGRSFGRHKLAPSLSPKKTWEGAIGGLVAAMGGAVLFGWISGLDAHWLFLALLGGLLDAAGVLGDLGESLLKRAFGVKDSGGILPGHGGILDRVDSLLFSAPLLYAVLALFDHLGVLGTLPSSSPVS